MVVIQIELHNFIVLQLIPVCTPSLLPISSLIVPHLFCTCSDSRLSHDVQSLHFLYCLYYTDCTLLLVSIRLVTPFLITKSTQHTSLLPKSSEYHFLYPLCTPSLFPTSSQYIIIFAHIQYPILLLMSCISSILSIEYTISFLSMLSQ